MDGATEQFDTGIQGSGANEIIVAQLIKTRKHEWSNGLPQPNRHTPLKRFSNPFLKSAADAALSFSPMSLG